MEISTEVVKSLRDKTGVSVMQCRAALLEAGGDLAKAEVILKKRAGAGAEKKADRTLGAGAIGTYVHDASIGGMVLLSCETDFVSKNPEFGALAREIAMQITATDPKFLSLDDVPTETKEAARAVFEGEIKKGTPEEMKTKILEGKMASYFSDKVLLDQPYIKDETKKVRDLLHEATQKFGERVEITQFARFSARG